MGGLFKILLFTSPVLALIFYYVVSQQNNLDVEMKKDEAAFERSWNKFEEKFAKDPEEKKYYRSLAEEADIEFKRLKEKEREKEQKSEKFERDFEKAIEEFEKKEKQKGGEK